MNGANRTYDANGHLTAASGQALTWDGENRLSQAVVSGTTTNFAYDSVGERIAKASGTNVSIYPFGDDYEIRNGTVTKYISVEGLGVVAKRVGTTNSWLHTDRLGSIQVVTNSSGSPQLGRTYRPYGETLTTSGSHTEFRGWIDQRNDSESGYTYLHARYFDPKLGQFLSPDPIRTRGGLNLYAYGLGSPVNGTDRSGLSVCFVNSPHPTGGGNDPNYKTPLTQLECVGQGPYQSGRELGVAEANYGQAVNTRITTVYVGDGVYAQHAEQLYVAQRPVVATVEVSETFGGVKPGPELTCATSANPAACGLALGVTALKPDEVVF